MKMKNFPEQKRVVNIISATSHKVMMDIDEDYILFIKPLGTVFKLNGDTIILDVSTLYDMNDVVEYIRGFNN